MGDKKKLFHSNAKVIEYNNEDYISLGELKRGEGLSSISMMKRFYKTTEFPSTSKIAILDTLKTIFQKNNNLLSEFALCLGEKPNWEEFRNGQLFFSENLTKKYFDKEGLPNGGRENAIKKLENIRRQSTENDLTFSQYYAIIMFDVDGMGKKLQACKSKTEYQLLSGLLAQFASICREKVDENNFGQTIYAGGDDYLGFLNLNHLFDVIKELRRLLNSQVNSSLPPHLQLSFSAGIAIGHYKTPLSEVLGWARKMEKEAKNTVAKGNSDIKKDAFSIAVLKHSGDIHQTTWRWETKGESWIPELFEELTIYLRNREISNKFISNLSQVFSTLIDDNDGSWGQKAQDEELNESLDKILKLELKRFLKRAKREESRIDIEKFSDKLFQIYTDHTKFDFGVDNFLNLLHICDFISRHINKSIKFSSDNDNRN